jgi:hypothetical protein
MSSSVTVIAHLPWVELIVSNDTATPGGRSAVTHLTPDLTGPESRFWWDAVDSFQVWAVTDR